MRRLGVITAAIVLTMLLQTVVSFASGLQVVDTHPTEGGARVSPINFAIRVNFDRDVSGGYHLPENQRHFIITDPEGEEQPATVLFDPNNPQRVLVVLLNDLEADTEFKLTISGDFTNGTHFLGDDFILRFNTRDMARDMNTSMIMMFGFLVVMMIISAKQMKRKAQKEAEEKDKDSRVNPYKVSKRTGKPVTEIVEKDAKHKRKKAEEEAKKKEEQGYDEDEDNDDERDWEYNDNYRVAEPRVISKYSTYKSGKKAKAEAAAKRRAAAGTTKPKNQTGKAKNKKKK